MDDDTALGQRIRTFREQANLTAKEVAHRIGVDPTAFSKIESGKRSVKTTELADLATTLGVSPLALLGEDSLSSRLSVARRRSPTGSESGEAQARLIALADLHQVLAEDGLEANVHLDDLPSVDISDWRGDAARLAAWARGKINADQNGTGNFSDLAVAIEEHLGIDVIVEAYPDDGLIGAAIVDREFPLLFVNAREFLPRALFTLAHELGHVLASDAETIAHDHDLANSSDDERFANEFAAAFLMPEAKVEEQIARRGLDVVSMATMLHDFGVSFLALVCRLHNLGCIDTTRRDRMLEVGWKEFVAEAARPSVRDMIPQAVHNTIRSQAGLKPERTPPNGLLSRAIEGYRQGTISVRPVSDLLGGDSADLFGLSDDDTSKILSVDTALADVGYRTEPFDGSAA